MSRKKPSVRTEAHKEASMLPPLPHMHTTPAIFGKRLTDILRQKGWSQSDLAAMIWGRKPDSRGFQVAQKRDLISSYCKGEMLPSRDNLQKIAEKLDMTADELLPAAQLQPLQDIGVIQSQTKRDDPRSVIWNARIDISKELATFFEEMYARFCEAREKGETFKLPRL